MPDANGDYLSRFERVEKTLERIAQIQEVQARNLPSMLEIQQMQVQTLDRRPAWLATDAESSRNQDQLLRRHEEWLARHELVMSEIDGKLNALIDIVMKREGGPESPA